MRNIEPSNIKDHPSLTKDIRDFWSRNVNAERIMGNTISQEQRGGEKYFAELEDQRYRSHRHLGPWINSMETGKTVLELGCGIGMDTFSMAKKGLNVTALDLTEVGVRTAKNRFINNKISGSFLAGNAEMLPIKDNSFDYVYSFGVLHHAANTEKTITEVYRVLRSGGIAKIMLYHRHSINELVHRITKVPFEEKDELCPVVRRFSTKEIETMFKQFSKIHLKLEYVFGEGYGKLFSFTPRPIYNFLSKHWGWHIMITAKK
jgi:ubiquinone/menaquinone biosynthesis C-methylase UbiE